MVSAAGLKPAASLVEGPVSVEVCLTWKRELRLAAHLTLPPEKALCFEAESGTVHNRCHLPLTFLPSSLQEVPWFLLLITQASPPASSFNINEKDSDSIALSSHFNCQVCKYSCLTIFVAKVQEFHSLPGQADFCAPTSTP